MNQKNSDISKGLIGKYKKEKNQTKFGWIFTEDGKSPNYAREESKDLDIMKF